MQTFEQRLESSERRILRADDRFMARMEPRWDAAEQMVGELSSGKCYVWPVGGKYREGTRFELVQFLVRNKYA